MLRASFQSGWIDIEENMNSYVLYIYACDINTSREDLRLTLDWG
jgi:hypothetical protein